VLSAAFTLAQFYQYNHRILHPEGMDRQKYAYTFMRFDDAHRDQLGGMYRAAPFNPNGLDTLLHEKWTGTNESPHWRCEHIALLDAPDRSPAAVCGNRHEFGPSFSMNTDELPTGRALYLAIGFERRVRERDDTHLLMGVATIEDGKGIKSFYQSFAMEHVPPQPNIWEHIEYRISLPPLKRGEFVKFYFWNREGAAGFEADDLDATMMAVKPY
jgi:hypothetical protein